MSNPNPFQWRHFEAEIILLCVRWYLRVRHVTDFSILPLTRSPQDGDDRSRSHRD